MGVFNLAVKVMGGIISICCPSRQDDNTENKQRVSDQNLQPKLLSSMNQGQHYDSNTQSNIDNGRNSLCPSDDRGGQRNSDSNEEARQEHENMLQDERSLHGQRQADSTGFFYYPSNSAEKGRVNNIPVETGKKNKSDSPTNTKISTQNKKADGVSDFAGASIGLFNKGLPSS